MGRGKGKRELYELTPGETEVLRKQLRGEIERKTILNQQELLVVKQEGEKAARDLDNEVTNLPMDRDLLIPVINTKTGQVGHVVPKHPNPIYFEQHAKSGLTIYLCRRMAMSCSIMLVIVAFCTNTLWVHSDYYYPLEFFRILFESASRPINRRLLEYRANMILCGGLAIYGFIGAGANSVFPWNVVLCGFFTWSVPFLTGLCFCIAIHIFNLTQLDTDQLKRVLKHTLWSFNYTNREGITIVSEHNTLRPNKTAWNQAQSHLKCCGVDRYTDWYVDWGQWLDRKDKPSGQSPEDLNRFPESCCPLYNLHNEYGYTTRTRPYAIRMHYCQLFPSVVDGCFSKLIVFFQTFTQNLIWIITLDIILVVLAAGWTFGGYVRYKRHKSVDHNYQYTLRDWLLDFTFLRLCVKVNDARHKRIGPEPQNYVFHDRPFVKLETRRPMLIRHLNRTVRHQVEDDVESDVDTSVKESVEHLVETPIIEVVEDSAGKPRKISNPRKKKVKY